MNRPPAVHRARARRIVSLAPSATDILCRLGAQSRLVGVTRWCKDVAAVNGLPALGDCWSTDAATIARLRPGLVIGSVPYRADTVQAILDRGLTFLAMNPRRLADIFRDIELLGQLTRREARAQDIAHEMKARLAAIARRARRARTRPRVYCESWPNPLMASPPWVEELVELAGGRFVPARGGRCVTSREVIAAKPQLIVLAWAATGLQARPDTVVRRSGWRQLPAVRDGKICVVRDELLNTPSPVLVRGAQILASLVHPEIFGLPPKGTVHLLAEEV